MPSASLIETAWSELRGELLRFLVHQTGESAAEDLLQDVFVRLARRGDLLVGKSSPRAWIYQVARNAVIDHWRRRRNTVELPAELPVPEPNASENLRTSLAACLRPLIDGLPRAYADALRLTELNDVPHAEAARHLGISVTALKSRVRRGRERLRAGLTECCHFEFSRTGRVIDYQPRGSCCAAEKPDA